MHDETRKTLQLFIEKADKLQSLGFLSALNELGFHWNTANGEEKLEITGPTQEQIDAFVLTFRLFIQKNDRVSLRSLATKIEKDPGVSEHWKQEFRAVRTIVNNILDSFPPIQVSAATYGPPTRRDIIDIFINGDLAHVEEDKREKFKAWMHNLPTKGFLSVQFVRIVATITLGLFHIAEITKK